MKTKNSSNSPAAKIKAHPRRVYSPLCGMTVKSGALDGIALRVIMSDIPKYKTGENNLKDAAAKKPAGDDESENE